MAAACCHCIEHERSAHRTLHRSRLAKRTGNAQYDEAAYRYPSWGAPADGDGQGDFGGSGRPEPQAELGRSPGVDIIFALWAMMFGGRALLDLDVGVDSLDAFMLTGLKLDLSGCSPPRFFFARASSQVLSISYCACIFAIFLFPCLYDLFTFLATTHVSSRWSRSMSYHVVLQCCYGFWVPKR